MRGIDDKTIISFKNCSRKIKKSLKKVHLRSYINIYFKRLQCKVVDNIFNKIGKFQSKELRKDIEFILEYRNFQIHYFNKNS